MFGEVVFNAGEKQRGDGRILGGEDILGTGRKLRCAGKRSTTSNSTAPTSPTASASVISCPDGARTAIRSLYGGESAGLGDAVVTRGGKSSLLLVIWLAVRQSPQEIPRLLICLLVLLDVASPFFDLPLVLLRIVLSIDSALWTRGNKLQSGVSDDDWKTKGQVKHTTLAAVLQSRAGQTYIGTFGAGRAVGLPGEDGKGSSADLAFGAMVGLEHLNVRVIREAIGFANGRKLCRLPAGAVEILLDLWGRHDDFDG